MVMNELDITAEQAEYFEKLGVITADELRIAFRKSCEDLEKIGLEADRVRAEQAEEGEKNNGQIRRKTNKTSQRTRGNRQDFRAKKLDHIL
jgi:hypothetical protein